MSRPQGAGTDRSPPTPTLGSCPAVTALRLMICKQYRSPVTLWPSKVPWLQGMESCPLPSRDHRVGTGGYGPYGSSQHQEDPQAAPSPATVLSTRSLRGGGESLACTFTLLSGLGAESTCTVIMKVIYKASPLCP